jgi:uncharacterized protein YkwD
MFRVDERILAASVVGLFVLGAGLGFLVGGVFGGTEGGDADQTPTAVPTDVPTATATAMAAGTTTPSPTAAPTGTPTSTTIPPPTATATPTTVPTPTAISPTPVAPTVQATRTPMLLRRFDFEEIEMGLRDRLNQWRIDQDLEPFGVEDGRLVADLNEMAKSHSVAMADADKLAYTIDGRTSADRYREYDLYYNCVFDDDDSDYTVTPPDNDLEILAKTYAGITYDTANGTDFNGNETEVAEDIFQFWMDNAVTRDKLSERNVSRIGIGMETTGDNEVFVTGNLCG